MNAWPTYKYFMKLATEWMNGTSYVERYAWFFPNSVPAVNASGALTEVGVYWNNIVSPVSIAANIE